MSTSSTSRWRWRWEKDLLSWLVGGQFLASESVYNSLWVQAHCLDHWFYWKDWVVSLDVTCFYSLLGLLSRTQTLLLPHVCLAGIFYKSCFNFLCLIFVFVGDHNTWPSLYPSWVSWLSVTLFLRVSFRFVKNRPRLALKMSACYVYGYWFHSSKMEYFLYRHRWSLSRPQCLLVPSKYAKGASKQLLGKWKKTSICTNWELFWL